MSQFLNGRHRAPHALSAKGIAFSRTAKATAIAATSGGLLATIAVPANAAPRGVVDDVAAVSAGSNSSAVNLLSVDLNSVIERADRPVEAAVAPQAPAVVAVETFGTAGFVGVEPEPEPEPEPVVEAAPAETTATAAPAAETTAAPAETSAPAQTSTTSNESAPATTSASTSQRSTSSSASRSQTTTAAAPAPAPAASGSGIIGTAAAYTGIMYVFGGTTPAGFDCSGYTSYVYAQNGISLPRTAAAQQSMATPVSNPVPGDLVFWGYPAYHVGIYAGDGMIYDSGRAGIPTQKRNMFSGVSGYGRVG